MLVVLAAGATIYLARSFLLPITFALLLAFILSPVIRALGRLHIPAPIAAALILLSFVGAVGFAGYEMAGPVEGLIKDTPGDVAQSRHPPARARKTGGPGHPCGESLEHATDVDGSSRTPQVVLQGPSLASRALGTRRSLEAPSKSCCCCIFCSPQVIWASKKWPRSLPREAEASIPPPSRARSNRQYPPISSQLP